MKKRFRVKRSWPLGRSAAENRRPGPAAQDGKTSSASRLPKQWLNILRQALQVPGTPRGGSANSWPRKFWNDYLRGPNGSVTTATGRPLTGWSLLQKKPRATRSKRRAGGLRRRQRFAGRINLTPRWFVTGRDFVGPCRAAECKQDDKARPLPPPHPGA